MQAVRPRHFQVLFTAVISAGAVMATWAYWAGSSQTFAVVIAAAVTVLLQLSGVWLNENTRVTLAVVGMFVAMAYGGVVLAVTVGLVTGLTSGRAARSNRFVKAAYNTGMDVVGAGLAALAFAAVAGVSVLSPAGDAALNDPKMLTAALIISGLVYTLVNALFMSAVLWASSGVPFSRTLLGLLQDILALQFVYVGLAAIAYVLLVRVHPVALVLVAVPLLVARRSLLSVQERQDAFDRMVRAFVKAIELKDGYTRGHAERVSDLSVLVAERMGLSYEDRQLIRYGAILHDVGKIGVSLGILCKAGPLDDDEFAEMKTHPEVGAAMLADITFLEPALAVVHHHHERMDGRGYPAGLAGDEIPLLTRVVTAVDAFDAMTSTRSYRRALPIQVALEELEANAGTQFDATVVTHLVAVIAEHGWEITDEPVAVATVDSSRTSVAMP